MTDLPFKAHYTDDAGETQCRAFATNAEAHAFRRTLVDGKPPKDEHGEAEDSPKDESPSLTLSVDDKASTTLATASKPVSRTAAALNGPKVEPSETGSNG